MILRDGTDSLSEALKLLVSIMGVETDSFLPRIRVMAAILRAKVRRAIVGRIPLASKTW
jgi:hypothetical protein